MKSTRARGTRERERRRRRESFARPGEQATQSVILGGGGGGSTLLQENIGDVPLDGVAFSIDLLEWGRKFSDFWGK